MNVVRLTAIAGAQYRTPVLRSVEDCELPLEGDPSPGIHRLRFYQTNNINQSYELAQAGEVGVTSDELGTREGAVPAVAREQGNVPLTDDLIALGVASDVRVEFNGSIGVIALGYARGFPDRSGAYSGEYYTVNPVSLCPRRSWSVASRCWTNSNRTSGLGRRYTHSHYG